MWDLPSLLLKILPKNDNPPLYDNDMTSTSSLSTVSTIALTTESASSTPCEGPAKVAAASIHATLVAHSRQRLFVNPLDWTAQHLLLLRVTVRQLRSWPAEFSHRLRCPRCSAVGRYNATLVRFMNKHSASRAGFMAILISMASGPMLDPASK
jgi:hypothetical protein